MTDHVDRLHEQAGARPPAESSTPAGLLPDVFLVDLGLLTRCTCEQPGVLPDGRCSWCWCWPDTAEPLARAERGRIVSRVRRVGGET